MTRARLNVAPARQSELRRRDVTNRGGAWAAVALWSLAGVACRTAAPLSPPEATTHPLAHSVRADGWAQLSWEERHDKMTWLVLPNMARLFQRMQGTEYPELTCRTCHGADGEAVGYQMPHGLPALDPERMPNPSENSERGRRAKWMAEEVTPAMARLLGKPVYDLETKSGFGCFQCHPAAVE